MMKKILFISCFLYSLLGWGQTNPTAQSLPYSQDFGISTFTTMPAGMAAWNGLNGGDITTQASAEGSTPTGNATLSAVSAAQTSGGVFGYSVSSNAKSYIQTSSNATNGVNQIVLAINTSGLGSVNLSYDVEIISAQPRTIGIVAQYRVGTSGSWTTLTGTGNPYSQAGGTTGLKTSPSLSLPAPALNQAVVQIRWATWRGTESGNSSGIAIDNISVTGTPSVTLDGIMNEADWGSALATSSGGPTPGFGANHVINALYSYGDATHLYFGIAGNVQSGNRILLFIDSKSGGYNQGNFGRTSAPSGINNWNSGNTFDAGFTADYCAVIGTNGSGTYFLDLFTLEATGASTYIGANGSADFGVTVDNTDQTRGFEFRILKTALNYTANQELQLFACYISDGGFLSNQFLTRANSGDGNYGSGVVNFGAAAPNPVTVPYNSKQTGNWNDGSTWRLGTASPTNVSIGVLNGHNVTVNVAAENVNNVNVNSGGTLTISGTNSLAMNNNLTYTNAGTTTFTGAGTLNIGTGATFNNSGTYTAGSSTLTIGSGTFNTSGTFNAGTGTVNINGATTINNSPTLNNLNYSGALTLTGTTTVTGTLRVNSGGFISSGIPTFGSSSTLEYLNVSGYGVNNEWTSNATTAGSGTPQTVILNNSSINMPGGARSVAGNITIGAGSTLNLNGSIGADLNVGGNWINSGTLNANSRAVTFRGTNQSITGATTFAFLTHNSSGVAGSNVLTINNNITVNNQLNLINGLVTLASSVNVSIGNNGTIAATSGNFNSASTNGTITFTGAGTTTGTVNFYPAVVQSPSSSQAVSYSVNSRIHNTLTLNSNSFLTNAPSYETGSTLIYNSGGSYTRAVEWGSVGSTFPQNGFPHHVRIQNGTTLNVETGLTGTLRLNGNLTLGNTGSTGNLNMQATTHDLEVRGNVVIGNNTGTSTLTLSTTSGSDLFVAGNWNRTANGALVSNSRLVEFNGTSLQTINDATTFDFLAINNAAGVNLVGTVSANQSIRFTNGNFTLGSANRIGDSSLINFNGGTFRTSASGAGFSDVVGAMNLTENSTFQLGTGDHTITFANSTSQTWTSGRVLTINGWTGTPTASGAGTAGKIQVGVGGLTAGQLEQIQFTGFDLGAVITASGELVPRDFPTFYSKGSLAPNLTTSWSRTTDGTGASPLDFTAGNTRYIIQNGHHMTTSAAWSITGANSILRILDGGTLQSTFAITVPSTATFEIQDGGTYVHDNSISFATTIFQGSEIFGNNSTIEFRDWNNTAPSNTSYGNIIFNVTINISGSIQFLNAIENIYGNLTILNTGLPTIREVRLTASTSNNTVLHGNLSMSGGAFTLTGGNGDSTLTVLGNVSLTGGILRLNTNTTGSGRLITEGVDFEIGSNLTFSGTTPSGNTGFYFNRNGVQNVTIGQAFTSGNYRDRFFYNAAQTTINETYNGTVAQETVNGTGATPLTGYSAWPLTGTGINNFTVNNAAGVTLRNARSINGDIHIANGVLNLSTHTINRNTNGGILTLGNGGGLRINGSDTFPVNYASHNISSGSSVEYAGTAQVIAALNSNQGYGTLILSGSGNKTLQNNQLFVNNNLNISGTANLQVDANQIVTVVNNFTNSGGTATFENNASLIQLNGTTASNSGNILYRRTTRGLKHLDFVYWSSMVEGQTIFGMWMSNASENF
ncbi:MAG: beta strand repeat-containing protein, partial [Flavobacterium sp.]